MNLSDFSIKTENPWNDMDSHAQKDLQDARDTQIKNWRDVIYKNIDLNPQYASEADKIPDDHFEHGKIDGKEKDGYYCNDCGAMLDTKGKCYYCNEIGDKKEEKEAGTKKKTKSTKK